MDEDLKIADYSNKYQKAVKELVIRIHEEFGFMYDAKLDYDLDDPDTYYGNAGGVLYMLLHGKKVVGPVAVKKISTEVAELKRMYLLPEYRGQGLGAILLKKTLEFVKAKGFKTFNLDTTDRQADAIALYQQNGFHITKQEAGTIFMTLDLGSPMIQFNQH